MCSRFQIVLNQIKQATVVETSRDALSHLFTGSIARRKAPVFKITRYSTGRFYGISSEAKRCTHRGKIWRIANKYTCCPLLQAKFYFHGRWDGIVGPKSDNFCGRFKNQISQYTCLTRAYPLHDLYKNF